MPGALQRARRSPARRSEVAELRGSPASAHTASARPRATAAGCFRLARRQPAGRRLARRPRSGGHGCARAPGSRSRSPRRILLRPRNDGPRALASSSRGRSSSRAPAPAPPGRASTLAGWKPGRRLAAHAPTTSRSSPAHRLDPTSRTHRRAPPIPWLPAADSRIAAVSDSR